VVIGIIRPRSKASKRKVKVGGMNKKKIFGILFFWVAFITLSCLSGSAGVSEMLAKISPISVTKN